MRYLIALLIAPVFISLYSCSNDPIQESKAIPDAFKQNERLGRGGNLGNILYRFDTWDKEREMEEFDLIKETGFQGVRINTGPFAHVSDAPSYTLSEAFFERLDWAIDQALARDLTVIIDNHEYHAMGDDPMGNHKMFLSTWKQMAEHYKDYPDNVFLGVLNEPNGRLTPYLWNYLLADVLKVIRETDPYRTLVIGPGDWNGMDALESFELPEDDRNIIVEVHYYSPHRFTHQGVSFDEGAEAWLGTTWSGTPEEKQAVIDDFKIATDWAEKHKRPLYLGEFGVYRKADMESRAAWFRYVVAQAEKNNWSWGVWNLMGNSFGIYDPDQKAWIEPLKDAILPPE
ncbi:glycoside hydrolase family 5 protein [Bacteroidota bacterium]